MKQETLNALMEFVDSATAGIGVALRQPEAGTQYKEWVDRQVNQKAIRLRDALNHEDVTP